MNPVQRAVRALSSWWGGSATYVDIGTGRPIPVDSGCAVEGMPWQRAASVPALLQACSLYADQVATLPRSVCRRDANGTIERDTTSDSARALARTSFPDWEGAALACCLTGNGYLRIRRNERGGPQVLEWIPTARVCVESDDRRRLWYRLAKDYALGEVEELLPESDVVHLRYRMASGNRVMGTSPAMLCSPALAVMLDARQLQRELLVNLSVPSFVMTMPGKLAPEALGRLRTAWDENFSKRAAGRFRTAFADQGMTPEAIPTGDAVRAQMVESFRFSIEEVARMYSVPSSLLGESGAQTSANSAESMRAFAATSLGPFTARVADELTRKLVADGGWHVEFDLSGLLQSASEQADRVTRYLNAGAMSLNEVRAFLGLPPVTGGDAIRAPVNVAPIDRWLVGQTAEQQPGHDEVPAVNDPEGGEGSQDQKKLRAVK
jgi:HK97 family phage portal protein